jgi:NAD(P)-dependent dehydrogenase (short-subunit alcohol dehydrogenase family)
MTEQMAGKRVLVTGGSMGIGRAVSRLLAARGARVIVAARGSAAVHEAVAELDGEGHQGLTLDVGKEADWRRAMAAVDRDGALHGLVTAAGVLGPIGPIEAVDPARIADALGINLFGTVLALHHSIPRLKAASGRAVTFSGGGATGPLARYDAYAASKAAVVRLTENVAEERSIEVNAIAPGFVVTRMHQDTLAAGRDVVGPYFERTLGQLERGGFPAAEAAELVCFLLSDRARGISGRLLSAQWDPWREPEFQQRLRDEPSLATLRRIDDQLFAPVSAD